MLFIGNKNNIDTSETTTEISSSNGEEILIPPNKEEDSSVIKKGIVLYTDGSARPTNPGYSGWGFHGYIYDIKDSPKEKVLDRNLFTTKGYIKTDVWQTTYKDNTDISIVEPTHFIDALGSNEIKTTNNNAELQALFNCFSHTDTLEDILILEVFSDSEYIIKGLLDKCQRWKESNWKNYDGSHVINKDLWIPTYEIYLKLLNKGIKINVSWVRAHIGNYGNEQANMLAGTASVYSTQLNVVSSVITTEYKKYLEVNKHPFLNFARIYFNSVDTHNTPGQYYQADSGLNDFVIGKRIPETGFSIVRFNDSDEILESIKQRQFDLSHDINSIIMLKTDEVYGKDKYRFLKNYGKHCLLRGSHSNLGLIFPDKVPITVEVNPTNLSLRAIDSLNYLEEMFDKFLSIKDDSNNKLTTVDLMNWHDITDTFFDIEIKKVKGQEKTKHILKKTVDEDGKKMKLTIKEPLNNEAKELTIPLILGMDILPRNNLKKLEGSNPVIHLITWRESRTSVRYATVIQTNDAVGIWSNFFSDTVFF